MATRLKTIRVPINFANTEIANAAALTTVSTPTIYIPECNTNSVTFDSVMYATGWQDTAVAATSLTAMLASVQLAGAAANTGVNVAGTLTNTGENISGILGVMNVTPQFTTYWTGTAAPSKVLTVQLKPLTTPANTSRMLHGYLDVTYQFNDAEPYVSQTICIPFPSHTGVLGTANNSAGGNITMPQLTGSGGWMDGYANLTIDHCWLEIKGMNSTLAVTDYAMNVRIDGAASNTSLPIIEGALNSMTNVYYNVDLSALAKTTTHLIEMYSTLADRFSHIVRNIWVTFRYTPSGTANVLNYIEIPFTMPTGQIQGTNTNDRQRANVTFYVTEPATIVQRAVCAEMTYTTIANATMQVLAGSQTTATAYAGVGVLWCGHAALQHNCNSGIAITRGKNDLSIGVYRSAGAAEHMTGVVKILYQSNPMTQTGNVHNHNHTVRRLDYPLTSFTATALANSAATQFPIPETEYFIDAYGYEVFNWYTATGANYILTNPTNATPNAGFYQVQSLGYITDGELAPQWVRFDATHLVKRTPTWADLSKIDVEVARRTLYGSFVAARPSSVQVLTYRSGTWAVSGNVVGSSGGTVSLKLVSNTTNTVMAQTTRSGNGAFSFTVYDDTDVYQVYAHESSTRFGASRANTAATNFEINLDPSEGGGGSPVTVGYTFVG